MSSKKSLSFADALSSADLAQSDVPKVKKVRTKSTSEKTSNISNSDKKSGMHSTGKKQSGDELKNKEHRHKRSSKHKHDRVHKIKQDDKSCSRLSYRDKSHASSKKSALSAENFSWCVSDSKMNSSSDSEGDSPNKCTAFGKSLSIESPQFVSNRKAGSAATDRRVFKLLEDENEYQQSSKMLHSVDEDLMLFDLQLKDDMEVDSEQKEEQKVPFFPPGLPFLHSLSCHKLYSLDKVKLVFPTANNNSIKGNNAIVQWFRDLSQQQQREVILNRSLMDSELGMPVVGHLFRYLIRYLSASSHHCRAATSGSLKEDTTPEFEVVMAVYQLLCYHISTAANPSALLTTCLAEMPLALVNIGCDPDEFPQSALERWCINTSKTLHSYAPNSAVDFIAQMQTLQLLLNALSNCLARVVSADQDANLQQSTVLPEESTLDDLVTWLSRLGQDPRVLSCSLHISVSTAIGHALQLYRGTFAKKVQDLVERLAAPWLDLMPETGAAHQPEETNSTCSDGEAVSSSGQFPHHTASFVCYSLLPDTERGRMLASSLAFLSLCFCLQSDNPEVVDYVEMSDVVDLIARRKEFLLSRCDGYILRSVLLLLDTCVTHAVMRQTSQQKMDELAEVSQFVRVELVRLTGGDCGGGPTSTRTKTQLAGLRTSMLTRWENIMHLGSRVHNPDGKRTMPLLGEEAMEQDNCASAAATDGHY